MPRVPTCLDCWVRHTALGNFKMFICHRDDQYGELGVLIMGYDIVILESVPRYCSGPPPTSYKGACKHVPSPRIATLAVRSYYLSY